MGVHIGAAWQIRLNASVRQVSGWWRDLFPNYFWQSFYYWTGIAAAYGAFRRVSSSASRLFFLLPVSSLRRVGFDHFEISGQHETDRHRHFRSTSPKDTHESRHNLWTARASCIGNRARHGTARRRAAPSGPWLTRKPAYIRPPMTRPKQQTATSEPTDLYHFLFTSLHVRWLWAQRPCWPAKPKPSSIADEHGRC